MHYTKTLTYTKVAASSTPLGEDIVAIKGNKLVHYRLNNENKWEMIATFGSNVKSNPSMLYNLSSIDTGHLELVVVEGTERKLKHYWYNDKESEPTKRIWNNGPDTKEIGKGIIGDPLILQKKDDKGFWVITRKEKQLVHFRCENSEFTSYELDLNNATSGDPIAFYDNNNDMRVMIPCNGEILHYIFKDNKWDNAAVVAKEVYGNIFGLEIQSKSRFELIISQDNKLTNLYRAQNGGSNDWKSKDIANGWYTKPTMALFENQLLVVVRDGRRLRSFRAVLNDEDEKRTWEDLGCFGDAITGEPTLLYKFCPNGHRHLVAVVKVNASNLQYFWYDRKNRWVAVVD